MFKMSMALVLVVGVALIIQHFRPYGEVVVDENPGNQIVGLPIEDHFIVSDRLNNMDFEVSLAYSIDTLESWFGHEMDAIVIGRVVDMGDLVESESCITITTSLSVDVLETVYG